MGPVAQDFHAAFGLGDSERTISSVDVDGVAMAAIQGLYQVVREREAEIAQLRAQLAELQQQLQSVWVALRDAAMGSSVALSPAGSE